MKQQTKDGKEVNKGFEDLKAWQLARHLMIESHKLADALPPRERYDLASQIRRSSKSVMANMWRQQQGHDHYGERFIVDSTDNTQLPKPPTE